MRFYIVFFSKTIYVNLITKKVVVIVGSRYYKIWKLCRLETTPKASHHFHWIWEILLLKCAPLFLTNLHSRISPVNIALLLVVLVIALPILGSIVLLLMQFQNMDVKVYRMYKRVDPPY